MRHSPRITVLLLAAGLVALAAGCGGGSKSSAPPTTTTQQQTTTMTVPTTGSSGPSFATAQNCAQFAGLAAQIASAMSTTSGDTTAMLHTEAQDLQALANAAPSDIKGDFQTFATAFSSYLQAVQNSGYKLGSTTPPTRAQLATIESALRVFNTTKLKQAEHHLTAWAGANCK